MYKLKFIFLYLLPSIVFNFKYLPFKQAIKLPIILYKPKFFNIHGSITITGAVKTGMIRMGFPVVTVYPSNGVTLDLKKGAEIVFNGNTVIGSCSFISVGAKGKLVLGNNIIASAALKLICHNYIKIGDNNRIGWECIIMDTSFHTLKSIETHEKVGKGYAPIILGRNNWFATQVMIMSGTRTPDFCVFGARTILTKKIDVPEYSVLAGSPIRIIRSGVYRDLSDDSCEYESYNDTNEE